MKALEVSVNGHRACMAGIRRGVLTVHVSRLSNARTEFISLDVGGREEVGPPLRWPMPKIGVGDEVTIRVVDMDTIDSPAKGL
jgi:hypothetical protein